MKASKSLMDFSLAAPIFIDANIFLLHAFNANEKAIEFLKKVESQEIKALACSLVLDEVFFKILLQESSNYIKRMRIAEVKKLLKDKERREKVMNPVLEYRTYLNSLFALGLKIEEVTSKDVLTAVTKSMKYGLLITDAVYLAVMKRKGIEHLASNDEDFEGVSEIILWKP